MENYMVTNSMGATGLQVFVMKLSGIAYSYRFQFFFYHLNGTKNKSHSNDSFWNGWKKMECSYKTFTIKKAHE